MQYDPENRTENGTENRADSIGSGIVLLKDDPLGLQITKNLLGVKRPKALPIDRWELRDEFVRVCIEMGLNAREISALSLSTPQPMKAVQQVYEKIEEQGLQRLYKSGRIEQRRKGAVGSHSWNMRRVWCKLVGQGLEYGQEISELQRDEPPEDGWRFRPDLGMRIGERRFFVEIQLSKLQKTRWREKMRNFLRYYERLKLPFRALILCDRPSDVNVLRQYGREILEDHPRLNLFYIQTLDGFFHERDIMKAPVWWTVWEREPCASLLG